MDEPGSPPARAPLVIRDAQMDVFREAAEARFEDDMVDHLRDFFPEQYAALGEEKSREVVRYGIGRARTYQLDCPQDLCAYLDVMFLFGRDFDVDERLPWAAAILGDPSISTPAARADDLTETALDYLRFLSERG